MLKRSYSLKANEILFSVSGISHFWTDDYKVFDQIYGKTSDKEIFGITLPPSISFGIDATKLNKEASEKKERFVNHYIPQNIDDDAYDFGNKYIELLKKQRGIKGVNKVKPTKSPFNFIGTDFKPITQNNDPHAYSYLKNLEQFQKYKEVPDVGGFKPYINYAGTNPEDTDAYKSIQDILDAHEVNKGKTKDNRETDEQVKYLNYGGPKGTRSKKPKPRAPPPPPPPKTKFKCSYGRCRKRATNTYRVLTRPIVRKIKHKIITY